MQHARRDARSKVVDTATKLLDDYGIADLTMRRLARELDVSPGALYWHFADKQALLGAVADRILVPAAKGDDSAPWQQRIHTICAALRDALLSTTDGAELVSASFAAGKSKTASDILARLSVAACGAGFPPAHADLAARTVLYYVLGFTADEQSRLQWDAVGALAEEQSVLESNPNARFIFGLQLLVDGMSARRGAASPPSSEDGVDASIPIPST